MEDMRAVLVVGSCYEPNYEVKDTTSQLMGIVHGL